MSIIVPGIVLCAGRSSRMGQPKALLPTSKRDETFIGRIVRVLREGGIDDVVVVVGPDVPPIDAALAYENPIPRVVLNPSPGKGQLSSLLVGLGAIGRPGVDGVLVTLVDVPLIDAETVSRLREAHQRTRAPVVRPVKNGRHGHPVIFDRVVFDELRHADHNGGAKTVVHAHLGDIVEVVVEVDGPFLDIDTPAEYMQIFDRELPRMPGIRLD
jgi:molybdenum cofactor cytidylyltransferase